MVPDMNRTTIVAILSVMIIAVVLAVFLNSVMSHNSHIESFYFYGNLSMNNTPAPAHTTILAKIDEKACGFTEIKTSGTYDIEVFAHPDTKKYVAFWIKTPSMESAVEANQKRTLPRSQECLLDLAVTIRSPERTVLHTGISEGASPANVTATTQPTPAEHTEYDAMLWDVVINEIMWDEKEYIELYNPGDHTIEIGNWTITRGTGAINDSIEITIKRSAIISAHGYYLIAKKDATTCKPDQISNMTLKNTGEVLQLFNGFPQVSKRIDVANCDGNWFAGKTDAVGQSMERILPEDGTNPDNWHTSQGHECGRIGTPGKENSIPDRTPPGITLVNNPIGVNDDIVVSFSERIDISTLYISVTGPYGGMVSGRIIRDRDMKGGAFDPDNPLQAGEYRVWVKCRDTSDNLAEQEFVLTVVDPGAGEPEANSTAKIVINELMPNPIGDDTGNETTELYNCGDASVDLGGWILENEDGKAYTIPADTIIDPYGYYLTTKIQLDNSGGQVFLYYDGEEVDRSINYTRSTEGKSWQRDIDGYDTDSDGDWIERNPTFGVSG